jgi:hypothetical protein
MSRSGGSRHQVDTDVLHQRREVEAAPPQYFDQAIAYELQRASSK